MISFQEVKSDADLLEIEGMAKVIWYEHYTPIIGAEQVVYMLGKFQSAAAMKDQIKQGYQYFRINLKEVAVGYLSFEKRGNELFLSKMYVLKAYRGKGIGRKSMEYVSSLARGLGCEKVSLTVNKFNYNSIKAYERSGFVQKGALVQDIGNGFVMDDYLMERQI